MCVVGTVMYNTQNIHQNLIRSQLCERLKLGNIQEEIRRSPTNTLNNLIVPTITVLFLSFPLFTFLLPIQIDYDPAQLILRTVESYFPRACLPHFLVKLIACIVLGSITFYGAGIVLSVALFVIMDLEGIQQHSSKLYLTLNQQIYYHSNRRSTENDACFPLRFRSSLKLMRIVRIKIQRTNEIMETNLFVWIVMSMCLSVSCLYGTIRLREELPLTTYFACPLIYTLFHLCVWLYFTLAAISRRTGEKFEEFWKCFVFGRKERIELRACPPIGYSVGPLRRVNEGTGVAVAFSVVDWTASIVVI
ncbi:unnamed protein product [Orchesella dallaii]|uniref:Gustatory receptor n=1 Tax=Orchesella dallaii TaxID=48710 RepID=A0ABP1RJ60_9HEXA